MPKSKRKNDEILQPTFLRFIKYIIVVSVIVGLSSVVMFFCMMAVMFVGIEASDCFISPCIPDWDDMADVADYYDFHIPSSASNIIYVNDDLNEYFEIQFDLPSADIEQIKNTSCQGNFYSGYDPSKARHHFSDTHQNALIKSFEYIFYSHSVDTPAHILGKLCRWDLAIVIDTSNPNQYQVTYTRYEYDPTFCEAQCFTTQHFVKPIDRSLFAVSGLHQNDEDQYIMEYDELCFDSRMYQIITPSDFYIPAFTQINIMIDDAFTLPTGTVTKQHRLVHDYTLLDESDHEYARYHQSPHNEFCIQRDWEQGKHTVDIEMILPDETVEHHSFDFYVE